MSRVIFHYIRLLRALSNLTLNISNDGASTTSLGNLFQCLSTLIINNSFLLSSQNVPTFSLKPLPLVLSLQALVHVFLVLGTPELDAVVQVGSHDSGVEWRITSLVLLDMLLFIQPRIRLAFWAASALYWFVSNSFIHNYPQVLLCSAALNPFIPQSVLILGIALTQVQDCALGLVELLKAIKVPHVVSDLIFSYNGRDFIAPTSALRFRDLTVCSPKIEGPDPSLHLAHIPQDCEFHEGMITAAYAATSLDCSY
ncbi:hypothetical protein QYF61_008547 [Mycteria americana]|uniref:Uncharacterized protein n=1 Tax=Mycteria americana TaxID=33587 RepID=A0AAN7S690_MYCAM|nr:hypothetical protein QYF61_008547 [Mycteria americana]